MWRPEPMRHVLVLLPEADLDRVARAVVETGLLHPTPLGAGDGGETGLRLPDVSGRLSELDRVLRDLEEAGNVLSALLPPDSLPTTPPMTEGPEPGFGAAERQRADEIIARVEDLQARELHLREECEKIEHAALGLRAWIQAGLPPGLGRELRHFDVVAGTVSAAQRAAFGRRLELVPDVASFFAQDPGPDGRVLVVVAARKGGGAALDEVFQAADFERVQWPSWIDSSQHDMADTVDSRVRAVRQAREEARSETRRLSATLLPELVALRRRAAVERAIVAAKADAGRTDRVAVLAGWVPAHESERLESAVRDSGEGRCVVSWRSPAEAARVPSTPTGAVPVLLSRRGALGSFELLTSGYGLPRYDEIDPTPIAAIAFLAMFGFMFGDVGHGLVLCLLGLLVSRQDPGWRELGRIIGASGAAAILFGFLYGSVFGVEDWLPPLWVRPMAAVNTLLSVALVGGVLLSSLGFVLYLVNAGRRGDAAAFWGRRGVPAALTYWTAGGLLVLWLAGASGCVERGLWILLVPLAVILLRGPWEAWRDSGQSGRRPTVGRLLSGLLESVIALLETVMNTVSQTATFLRLGAFSLAHAGLATAVFAVGDAVAASPAGLSGRLVVLVLGTAVIVGLEGLVVAIQATRLEYFEFFGKFHAGNGEAYRPLCFPGLWWPSPSTRGKGG